MKLGSDMGKTKTETPTLTYPWRPGGRYQGVCQVATHVTSFVCSPPGSPLFGGTELKYIVDFPGSTLSLCSPSSREESLRVSVWERKNLESAEVVASWALECHEWLGRWVLRNFCLGFTNSSGQSGTRQGYSWECELPVLSVSTLHSSSVPPNPDLQRTPPLPQGRHIPLPIVCVPPDFLSRTSGTKLLNPWNK